MQYNDQEYYNDQEFFDGGGDYQNNGTALEKFNNGNISAP